MYLQTLTPPRTQSLFIERFTGLQQIGEYKQNAFANMQGMASEQYPAIATRKPYRMIRKVKPHTQVFSHKRLLRIEEGQLFDGAFPVGPVQGNPTDTVSFMNRFIMMPGKTCYNSENHVIEHMENRFCAKGIRFGIGNSFGKSIEGYVQSDTPPENQALWLDTTNNKLRQYVNGAYQDVQGIYTCLHAEGIDKGFAVGDAVEVSGVSIEECNGSFVIEDVQKNCLVLYGNLSQSFTETNEVCIERKVPVLSSPCVWNFRVWGIDKQTQTLHASALGKPNVYYNFSGGVSDSFAMQIDNALALAALEDELLVFCKGGILRITGRRPQNFVSTWLAMPGIAQGCENSITLCQNAVYYYSTQGPMCYNGFFQALPACVPALHKAKGFALQGKYYLADEHKGLYCYDIARKLWHREESFAISSACAHGQAAFFVVGDTLFAMGEAEQAPIENPHTEETVRWFVETNDFSVAEPGNRKLESLQVNISGEGQYAVYAAFDAPLNANKAFTWHKLQEGEFIEHKQITCRISAKTCHRIRLRIEGEGEAVLHSLCQNYYV